VVLVLGLAVGLSVAVVLGPELESDTALVDALKSKPLLVLALLEVARNSTHPPASKPINKFAIQLALNATYGGTVPIGAPRATESRRVNTRPARDFIL